MKSSRPLKTKIRVMVVDDHPAMRTALRAIIDSQPDLELVAEADGGPAAIGLLARTQPDVVLMDGSMPQMNGMEATRHLRELQPDLKIIGLTLFEQSSYLEEMAAAGARGYVLKTGPPPNVVKAIRTVADGGTYFDPTVSRASATAAREREATEELGADELAVAKLMADGQTNHEIALSLGWTSAVVQLHRSAAMRKLGLRTRAELVRHAKQSHWLDE